MAFAPLIRKMVGVANKLVAPGDLQDYVTYERQVSVDRYGKKIYAAAVQLPAAIDWKQHQVRTLAGELTTSRAHLTFPDVAAVKAAAPEGFGDYDKFTLPDGTTGPILDMNGYIDPGTHVPFVYEVWLG